LIAYAKVMMMEPSTRTAELITLAVAVTMLGYRPCGATEDRDTKANLGASLLDDG